MRLGRKRRATISQHHAFKLADVGIAHGRRDTAIGYNAGDIEPLDAAFAQHPFEPRHVECRISDLLDRAIGRRQFIDKLLAPTAGEKVALAQKRPRRFEICRDERLSASTGHECKECRDYEHALRTKRSGKWIQPRGKRGNVRIDLAAARIGTLWMDEVILQINKQKPSRCVCHAIRSTMTLPSRSTRPCRPGSMKTVASGCSSTAGPVITAPTGRSRRDNTCVLCHAPSDHTGRAP